MLSAFLFLFFFFATFLTRFHDDISRAAVERISLNPNDKVNDSRPDTVFVDVQEFDRQSTAEDLRHLPAAVGFRVIRVRCGAGNLSIKSVLPVISTVDAR